MPELPDVEGFRRTFRRRAAGKQVRSVRAKDDIVRNTSPQGLGTALKGRRFGAPERRGKWLICPTGGPTVLMHFGMTGKITWSLDNGRHPRIHAAFEMPGGELQYRSHRKLGGIWLARDDDELAELLADVGPDALRIREGTFMEMLEGQRGSIKAMLMDQSAVAGLGNLTCDELLWRARIDPRRRVADLDDRERARIYRKMRDVLHAAIPEGRVPTSPSWLTGRRDVSDATCPRCDGRLRRATIAGRTSVFCPACQH